ncbi:DNA replication/repair protein RecF [Oceanivirga salmonicida]|uniref:DNA replication/repair protein RecF n=1 Tax=Oceanivirga salmonicida TaxID=1769291 RepID=UPI000837163C|nr:DNA replication and repair protein RecF [Oceanivirga salmonicida]
MYIEQILVDNFRILANKKFEFSKNFNLIYGKNAQGKTSLIEAVYFLASGKSFRTRKIIEQIKENNKRMVVFSKINGVNYSIELSKDKRAFYKNSNRCKYSEYLGDILVISFSPEDMDLIIGTPDTRRRFFNYEICQIDKKYLKYLLDFQKILKIRNKMIKNNEMESKLFEIYNEKFIDLSIELLMIRKEYIEELSIIINEKYQKLFGNKKKINLIYENFLVNLKDKKYNKDELKAEFKESLFSKKDKEKIYGYSILGPQKDDFIFEINENKVKSYASQGEKKSVLLALKLAQGDYIISKTNNTPIFLFDDISAYFDEIRKYRVMEYFKEKKIQCFFTSTEKIDIEAKYIKIEDGDINDEV